jgi:hypothetical protein
MKKIVKTLLTMLLVTSLLAGCTDGAVTARLAAADSLMADHPDSALALLGGMQAEKSGWAESQRMRHDLLTAKAMNKAFVNFTTDSVMREVADYYDSHGTANDRLLAHYLLGCTYRDLGEAPRAVDCFHDAIDAADTTASDCDYRTMGFAYSQMANVYHKQLLLTDEIESRRRASYYATLTRDTFLVLNSQKLSVGAYILLNKKDSAELIIKKVLERSYQNGYTQAALQSSTLLMHLYIDRPDKLSELKALIDNYEAKSKMFDEHHELPPSKRLYYFYKGKYFEGIHHYDSAEYYYRKISLSGVTSVALDPMYKGLLSVFTKRHQPDSIAKYAQLYCEANDSSIVKKDQELTAQKAASYNYVHYQKESRENEAKAYQFKIGLIIAIGFILLLVVSGYVARIHYKQVQQRKQDELNKRHQNELDRMKADFTNASIQYGEKLMQLRRLDEDHQFTILTMKKELKQSKQENREYKTRALELEQSVMEVNQKFESEKSRLLEEINVLNLKLDSLQRREEIATWRRMSIPFVETGIIKRIKIFADNTQKQLSAADMDLLVQTTNDYYPDFIYDLNNSFGSNKLSTYVCILTALKVSSGEITHLLGITSSQVSNLKQDVNAALFNDKTARTLYINLLNKYSLPNL